MTISRETALEWAEEAGIEPPEDPVSRLLAISSLEDLINRAYQEGQRDMRERAAKEIEDCSLELVTRAVAAIEIRNLEIE